ncbi:SpoIIE family protein phosphatase [Alkalitalea saponilacus]|uniref:Stage II sporulation protein E (SpoIIE) n=1 Tax=Alkalitalea saponilacus TaxID=889453 RepID=A0A1T5BBY0_9BACT|nr:SpoIIE family protein phosphatase [Alkalitalea saponilacus]ASB49726.1 stage II sporulation protein E [Alkalitalea saponilacus]SKB44510.1 Stage II sporulation protein E (SpoIIE) [Alkalitalea saponilacus]
MLVPESHIYIDIFCHQANHVGEEICGDVFLSRRIKEEGRTIVVLSDGMGSGIKANVLASLTASMAVNFTMEHREVKKSAEIIMNTLPVCSVRKISYSTFTIIDIEDDGFTTIVEYDNPDCVILRGEEIFDPKWETIQLEDEKYRDKEIRTCSFRAEMEDRILFLSDGIVQSGMGTRAFPFGWGRDGVIEQVKKLLQNTPFISSAKLARKIVSLSMKHDGGIAKDDTSFGVIYFREPRKMLLVSGPPFDERNDLDFALKVQRFSGKKIISGGTTAEIIARELALRFDAGMEQSDPELPPASYVEGMNLVTEGILTLGKAARILENLKKDEKIGTGPADLIVKYLLESDRIHIINGTRINVAHQDPNLPVELEIRRSVVKRIVRVLEDKFLKEVTVEYM